LPRQVPGHRWLPPNQDFRLYPEVRSTLYLPLHPFLQQHQLIQ